MPRRRRQIADRRVLDAIGSNSWEQDPRPGANHLAARSDRVDLVRGYRCKGRPGMTHRQARQECPICNAPGNSLGQVLSISKEHTVVRHVRPRPRTRLPPAMLGQSYLGNPMTVVYPLHLQREIDRRWLHASTRNVKKVGLCSQTAPSTRTTYAHCRSAHTIPTSSRNQKSRKPSAMNESQPLENMARI